VHGTHNHHPSTTDLAEDRTLLASERTFAGWMRTSLGCIGIAVGFHALFGSVEPRWLPQGIATLFLLLAIFIAWAAVRRAARLHQRLPAHLAETARPVNLALIAAAISLGAAGLAVAFWLLPSR
jgi:putative membrane protein